MIATQTMEREAHLSLKRILPRVEAALKTEIKKDREGWRQFVKRLEDNIPNLFTLYADVYSDRYDFFFHLEDLIISIARSWFNRPADLRQLDGAREADPHWFESNQMLGAVCYADLFAGDLEGVRSKISYFKELGITYLHLMPLFKAPEGENDGGYAVSSYRDVNPLLGTMDQLSSLARDFREAGISLVVDLVFNHTSDEHIWAERAKAGDEEFMDFYRIYPDRNLPDQFEQNLREIFPDEHSGAFTFFPALYNGRGGWVWTTFHYYQWDLNYSNPAV
ncbi:MAG TPA: alpha-amylase family glycosyl hydrolase, partial [Anaerolineales bacterium]|nr:alpha-amylase family glycosyl hydrolase [Anaerolineales bacterium]